MVTERAPWRIAVADAVRAGIAAANDDDVLAAGEDRLPLRLRFPAHAPVLLRQEIHGEMDALELAPGDRQIARLFRATGKHQRIVVLEQPLGGHVHADMGAAMERDPFRLHLLHAPVNVVFLHLEIGNAVAQQPAGFGELLEDVHLVPDARELLRAGKPRRP